MAGVSDAPPPDRSSLGTAYTGEYRIRSDWRGRAIIEERVIQYGGNIVWQRASGKIIALPIK
jgi:hypothetical protein